MVKSLRSVIEQNYDKGTISIFNGKFVEGTTNCEYFDEYTISEVEDIFSGNEIVTKFFFENDRSGNRGLCIMLKQ